MKNSTIPIYTPEEIEGIRFACKLASDVLVYLEQFIKPGVTTEEIDNIAADYIYNTQGAISACLGYHGFPKNLCTSRNDVVCHGIPNPKEKLHEGDILNVDVTVIKNGYYGDNSKMYIVGGNTTPRSQELVDATQEALYNAIRICRPGARFQDIGMAIYNTVKPHNFSIVREFIGHGVGKVFHDNPEILHYPNNGSSSNGDGIMREGMIFTIEPMINAGSDFRCRILRDGWTAVTRDRSNSAQFEHQLLITEYGCEIMTIRDEEIASGRVQREMHNVAAFQAQEAAKAQQ